VAENVRYAQLYDEILIAASDRGVSNLRKQEDEKDDSFDLSIIITFAVIGTVFAAVIFCCIYCALKKKRNEVEADPAN